MRFSTVIAALLLAFCEFSDMQIMGDQPLLSPKPAISADVEGVRIMIESRHLPPDAIILHMAHKMTITHRGKVTPVAHGQTREVLSNFLQGLKQRSVIVSHDKASLPDGVEKSILAGVIQAVRAMRSDLLMTAPPSATEDTDMMFIVRIGAYGAYIGKELSAE